MKTQVNSLRFAIGAAAFAILLSPVAATASAVPSYERFALTAADSNRLQSEDFGACVDDADGRTFPTRQCLSAELAWLDTRLNAEYRAAMARLPSRAARIGLRDLERRWLATRWDECRRMYADETGTLGPLLINDCGMSEVQRRIAWLERYGR